MIRLAIGLLVAALLGACAGEKIDERPPLAQRVFELGKEGHAAYKKGDLARARRLFELALHDALQIEDSAGVVTLTLNLARIAREQGESAKGLARLESVSAWHRQPIPPLPAHLKQEIDLLEAVLLADLGRADAALLRLTALRQRCPPECALAIGADSLQARLILEKGETKRALDLATAALNRFHTHDNRLEVANLLRVQGEARLAQGDFAAARQSLEEALKIDKAQAQPAKIALDLDALSRTAFAAQDSAAHALYQGRLDELRRAHLNGE
jgi:tetratricopeptide (TPR) repeat protein